MAEQEKFAIVMENLTRMEFIPRSPFVPTNLGEWLAHRVAYAEDTRREEIRKLANREAAHDSGLGVGRVRIGLAFGGKQFHDNRSSVLVGIDFGVSLLARFMDHGKDSRRRQSSSNQLRTGSIVAPCIARRGIQGVFVLVHLIG